MAMKRPAASTSGSNKKAKGPSVAKQCKEIAGWMRTSEYPKRVVKMITENLVACLQDYKEERHDFQARMAVMAEEVMKSVKVGLESQIAGLEEKLSKSDAEKTSREAAVLETKTAAEEKAKALEEAKKENSAVEAEIKAAAKALKTAEQEQKAGDVEVLRNEAKKKKLESAIQSVFLPCMEGALEEAAIKKGVADLQKLGKQENFDTALLTSLPAALSKEPATRGTFDNVVVKQVEDELQSRLAKVTAALAEAEPAKEERAAKVAGCKSTLETLKSKHTDLEKAQKEAAAASKVAEATAKVTAKALKAFFPEMKQATRELKEAKESLEDFTESALKSFSELLNHSKPAEPEAAS